MADISEFFDKAYKQQEFSQLADAPIDALLGLSESDAKALKDALNVTTVRELAENKFVRVAQEVISMSSVAIDSSIKFGSTIVVSPGEDADFQLTRQSTENQSETGKKETSAKKQEVEEKEVERRLQLLNAKLIAKEEEAERLLRLLKAMLEGYPQMLRTAETKSASDLILKEGAPTFSLLAGGALLGSMVGTAVPVAGSIVGGVLGGLVGAGIALTNIAIHRTVR